MLHMLHLITDFKPPEHRSQDPVIEQQTKEAAQTQQKVFRQYPEH
jgi:hypothetical protein